MVSMRKNDAKEQMLLLEHVDEQSIVVHKNVAEKKEPEDAEAKFAAMVAAMVNERDEKKQLDIMSEALEDEDVAQAMFAKMAESTK